ncbi:DUF6233 domain-containing protein [Streptomyces albogriseolus]|uniref:DUF6233 domain-containing protein n=1 Tax=Streptomyces albogriseolus TaxID=1887 RepID=UPI0037BBBE64
MNRRNVDAVHAGDCWAAAKSGRCRPASREQVVRFVHENGFWHDFRAANTVSDRCACSSEAARGVVQPAVWRPWVVAGTRSLVRRTSAYMAGRRTSLASADDVGRVIP